MRFLPYGDIEFEISLLLAFFIIFIIFWELLGVWDAVKPKCGLCGHNRHKKKCTKLTTGSSTRTCNCTLGTRGEG